MGIPDHVNLVITADSVSVARAGFKLPMVLTYTAPGGFLTRTKKYNKQAEVLVDFTADDPTALATGAIFGQNPRPPQVIVGRGTLPPTVVWVISVSAVTNSRVYAVNIKGKGVTATTATFTSDASALNDEIVAGLVTQINLVAGNNYLAAATGAGGSQVVTITADNPGNWFSVEVVDVTALSARMTHVDPGVATDLAAILLENDEWYWMYTTYNSEPFATAAATWAQSNRKLYVAQSSDTRDLGTSSGTNGMLDILGAAGRSYVASDYHPAPNQMSGAALIGNIAARTPGSYTAKFKRRTGVTPIKFTATERSNLVARKANFYEAVSGVNITSEGTTTIGPSDVRGFIDNVVALDAIENDIASGVFGAMAGADKIPRTNPGMIIIENQIDAGLRRGIANGTVAELSSEQVGGPSPRVEIPDVSTMDDLLPRGVRASFNFKLAGAIHHADINGVVVL